MGDCVVGADVGPAGEIGFRLLAPDGTGWRRLPRSRLGRGSDAARSKLGRGALQARTRLARAWDAGACGSHAARSRPAVSPRLAPGRETPALGAGKLTHGCQPQNRQVRSGSCFGASRFNPSAERGLLDSPAAAGGAHPIGTRCARPGSCFRKPSPWRWRSGSSSRRSSPVGSRNPAVAVPAPTFERTRAPRKGLPACRWRHRRRRSRGRPGRLRAPTAPRLSVPRHRSSASRRAALPRALRRTTTRCSAFSSATAPGRCSRSGRSASAQGSSSRRPATC
jgi:hypothetical protein